MYLAGVSTRQVDDTGRLLWGERMPSQTCISSNWCEQCRHLFWTLSAFMLDGMGGWLVSLGVVYFMSEWVFR